MNMTVKIVAAIGDAIGPWHEHLAAPAGGDLVGFEAIEHLPALNRVAAQRSANGGSDHVMRPARDRDLVT